MPFVDPLRLVELHLKRREADIRANCDNCQQMRWSYSPDWAKQLFKNPAIEMPVCGCCGFFQDASVIMPDNQPTTSGKFERAKKFLAIGEFSFREEISYSAEAAVATTDSQSQQSVASELLSATLLIFDKAGKEKLGEISYLPDFDGLYAARGRGFPEGGDGEILAARHWLFYYDPMLVAA